MEPLTAVGGGYGATKVAMAKTLEQIGGKMALGLMVGGGKKRKQLRRRKPSKHTKRISKRRVMSVKKMYKKKRQTKRLKRRKTKEAKKDIIKSIEYGKPISKKSFSSLSPSMQSFLAGIESGSQSSSTIRFSDFKTKSNKGKKKVNSRPRTRGGRIRGGRGNCDGPKCKIHKGGGCGETCPGRH